MEYLIITNDVIFEEEIKKSRFITYLGHASSLEQAKEFVMSVAKQHPKCRHACWAAVCGAPNNSLLYGFSDDGEPSGTAGKPMLNALIGSGVGEIVAVCVRYFGGVLLGTGGLCRAYGNGTIQALKEVTTELKVKRHLYRIVCSYELLNLVNNLLPNFNTIISNQTFLEEVTTDFEMPEEYIDSLRTQLTEKTSGTLFVEDLEL